MRRIMLTVAYDGTDFHGWQVQPGVRTVEGELNKCISDLLKREVQVIGASRTDAGVHSMGNLAVFDTDSNIPAEKFAYALNCKLPADVKVQRSVEVAEDFHPRKCTSVKTYEYRIDCGEFPMPINSRYAYYTYHTPDVALMREAAKYIVGEHDFKSFCSVHTQAESTVRTVYSVEVEQNGREIVIRVAGSGFLYNMVRIIAGTLLDAGMGKYEPSKVEWMIAQCDRTVAGPTLPPEGLRLCGIEIKE